jgi:hypothetical protein
MADSGTFQKKVQDLEKQKLTYYTEQTNSIVADDRAENLFIHLSLRQIIMNISKTFIGILDDLLTLKPASVREYLDILSKGDRLIYVGIIVVFIAFCLYLIDITN